MIAAISLKLHRKRLFPTFALSCGFGGAAGFTAVPLVLAMCDDNREGVVVMKPRKITQMSLDYDLVDRIDAYRRRQVGEIPTKSQAIRELLEFALRGDMAEVAGEQP
jgi:hypothetical protein